MVVSMTASAISSGLLTVSPQTDTMDEDCYHVATRSLVWCSVDRRQASGDIQCRLGNGDETSPKQDFYLDVQCRLTYDLYRNAVLCHRCR